MEHIYFSDTYGLLDEAINHKSPFRNLKAMLREARSIARHNEHVTEIRREKEVPPERSTLLQEVEQLPIAYRTARFLDADGFTRTVVYWTTQASALSPTDEQMRALLAMGQAVYPGHLLRLSASQQNQRYRTAAQTFSHRYFASPVSSVPVIETELASVQGVQHLALQWDQFLADGSVDEATGEADTSAVTMGPQLRLKVERVPDVAPLNPNESVLEMSDLVPRRVSNGEPPTWPVIVGDEVSREVALSFELYHLTLDGEGQSRFSVEVEVARVQGGVLQRVFGREERRTSSAAEFVGEHRTAKEVVIVDLAEARGEVVVTVRVRDQLSRQAVERQIRLRVE